MGVDETTKPYTLLLPKPGGPLFLSLLSGQPFQADINAAINIGLRAICAPVRLDIIHKIRSEKHGEKIKVVRGNEREKKAFAKKTEIQLKGKVSEKFKNTSKPNFFVNPNEVVQVDSGTVVVGTCEETVSSGIGTWSTVNREIPAKIVEINFERLRKYFGEDPVEFSRS